MTDVQQDAYLRRLLQHVEIEPLQIPLISPTAAIDTPAKRPVSRKKEKSALARFFKKFIYFKPKTFWGTQILIPILSTTIGIWITAIMQQPKHHRTPMDKGRIEHRQASTNTTTATNTAISTTQIAHSLDLLSQLYQSWDAENGFLSDKTFICPTCNHVIQVGSYSFSQPVIKCATCKQPYQAVNQESVKERE